jgi:hypothetical protein
VSPPGVSPPPPPPDHSRLPVSVMCNTTLPFISLTESKSVLPSLIFALSPICREYPFELVTLKPSQVRAKVAFYPISSISLGYQFAPSTPELFIP